MFPLPFHTSLYLQGCVLRLQLLNEGKKRFVTGKFKANAEKIGEFIEKRQKNFKIDVSRLSLGSHHGLLVTKRPPIAQEVRELPEYNFDKSKYQRTKIYVPKKLRQSDNQLKDYFETVAKRILLNRNHNNALQQSSIVPSGNPYQIPVPQSFLQNGLKFKRIKVAENIKKGLQKQIRYQMFRTKKHISMLPIRQFSTVTALFNNSLGKQTVMQQKRFFPIDREKYRDKLKSPDERWADYDCCPEQLDCDTTKQTCEYVFDCPNTKYPSRTPPDCPPPKEPPPPPEVPLCRIKTKPVYQRQKECMSTSCSEVEPIIIPKILPCLPPNNCPCIEPPPLRHVRLVRLPKICLCPDPPDEKCLPKKQCPPRADVICKYVKKPKKLKDFWCPKQKIPPQRKLFCPAPKIPKKKKC